jgi:hypothetical protein
MALSLVVTTLEKEVLTVMSMMTILTVLRVQKIPAVKVKQFSKPKTSNF